MPEQSFHYQIVHTEQRYELKLFAPTARDRDWGPLIGARDLSAAVRYLRDLMRANGWLAGRCSYRSTDTGAWKQLGVVLP